jgi:hypothetical protein
MIDRASLLLLLAALAGSVAVTRQEPVAPAETSRPAASAESGGGTTDAAKAADAAAAAAAKASAIEVVKAPPARVAKTAAHSSDVDFDFTIFVRKGEAPTDKDVTLKARWFSPKGGSFDVQWIDPTSKAAAAPPTIKRGELKPITARVKLQKADRANAGAGYLRLTSCATDASGCAVTDHALELAAEPQMAPRNLNVLWWPIGFAIAALVIGFIAVRAGQSSKPENLKEGAMAWRVGDSWAATVNVGAALVNSFAGIGITAGALEGRLTVKEYGAWIGIFALSAALAPTVFAMLKWPAAGNKETGTLTGFVAANFFNLFGTAGQLLLAFYGLSALGTAGLVNEDAASVLRWLPALLAAGMLYYTAVRFLLIANAAPKPATELGGAASGRSLML